MPPSPALPCEEYALGPHGIYAEYWGWIPGSILSWPEVVRDTNLPVASCFLDGSPLVSLSSPELQLESYTDLQPPKLPLSPLPKLLPLHFWGFKARSHPSPPESATTNSSPFCSPHSTSSKPIWQSYIPIPCHRNSVILSIQANLVISEEWTSELDAFIREMGSQVRPPIEWDNVSI